MSEVHYAAWLAALLTTVETPAFVVAAARCMIGQEKDEAIDFLAQVIRDLVAGFRKTH